MTKKIDFILYYAGILLAGCVCATFMYIQYVGCTHFVAGHIFRLEKMMIVYAFFQSLPVVLIFMPMLMTVYKIRHLSNPVWSALAFIMICVFSWGILYPLAETGKKVVCTKYTFSQQPVNSIPVSGGYFRESENAVYYFITDSDKEKSSVLKLSDAAQTDFRGTSGMLDVSENSGFYKDAFPFREPRVKESLRDFPYEIVQVFNAILTAADYAWQNGLVSWIAFCSLCFALASSYAYIKMSSWRLVNYLAVLLTNSAVLIFNGLYYSGFGGVRSSLNDFLYGSGHERLVFFSSRNIDMPIVIINVLFAVLVIVAALAITAAAEKWRNGYSED